MSLQRQAIDVIKVVRRHVADYLFFIEFFYLTLLITDYDLSILIHTRNMIKEILYLLQIKKFLDLKLKNGELQY